MLLAAGAEFSSNIYRRYLRPTADDAAQIRVARNVMIAMGVVATVLAIVLREQEIGVIVGIVVGGTGSAFAAPLVLGIWWQRANHVGGFLGVVVGFVAYLALLLLSDMPMFSHVLIALPLSAACVVAGSRLSSPPTEAQSSLVNALHGRAR
jgi:Na+/proline symporter